MNSLLEVVDIFPQSVTMTMSKASSVMRGPSYVSSGKLMMHHNSRNYNTDMMMDFFLSGPQTDSNNNSNSSEEKRDSEVSSDDSVASGHEVSGQSAECSSQKKGNEKYSLRPRSIQNRIETEKRRSVSKREPKPKQKPPPLSKYRRKTANARERGRMREINQAFETLRQAVPQFPQVKTSEKLTKITTLRLAMNYIEALKQILRDNPSCEEDVTMAASCSPLSHSSLASFSSSSTMASSLAPSLVPSSTRGSGVSSSDLGEYANDFLSDEGSTLGDPMDTFDDIIGVSDTFDILLESDGESLQFHSDLSDQSTP